MKPILLFLICACCALSSAEAPWKPEAVDLARAKLVHFEGQRGDGTLLVQDYVSIVVSHPPSHTALRTEGITVHRVIADGEAIPGEQIHVRQIQSILHPKRHLVILAIHLPPEHGPYTRVDMEATLATTLYSETRKTVIERADKHQDQEFELVDADGATVKFKQLSGRPANVVFKFPDWFRNRLQRIAIMDRRGEIVEKRDRFPPINWSLPYQGMIAELPRGAAIEIAYLADPLPVDIRFSAAGITAEDLDDLSPDAITIRTPDQPAPDGE